MTMPETVRDIDRMRQALEEIKRLHAEITFLIDDGEPVERIKRVCSICCLNIGRFGGYRGKECEESHQHTADGPACSTVEIIARAGL